MTLEEAIRLFEQREKADDPKRFGVPKTMAEYGAYCRQLAEWLRELKERREKMKKTCGTCKHNPPSKKWPCVDCDMREPVDRWEPQEAKHSSDLISRRTAIDTLLAWMMPIFISNQETIESDEMIFVRNILEALPSAQPEIIHCKDCKYYSPMNKETKTGICNLTMHQNFGDNWFCAGAERRTDE